MTVQDSPSQLSPETETQSTSEDRSVSVRVSLLQMQQLMGQFPFFCLISIVSIITIGILYWYDTAIHLIAFKIWFVLSLASISFCMGLIRYLRDKLKKYSARQMIRTVNACAGIMGAVWGIAYIIFMPSLPNVGNNITEFYGPA